MMPLRVSTMDAAEEENGAESRKRDIERVVMSGKNGLRENNSMNDAWTMDVVRER